MASDKAAFITGANMVVNGGQHMFKSIETDATFGTVKEGVCDLDPGAIVANKK